MRSKTMESFLDFRIHGESKSGLTSIFQVLSKKGNCLLGEIRWFAPWRRYVFEPVQNTTFDAQCLGEIQKFLQDEMERRK